MSVFRHDSGTQPQQSAEEGVLPNAYTHTHLFNGPLSGTTHVSWYQKSEK